MSCTPSRLKARQAGLLSLVWLDQHIILTKRIGFQWVGWITTPFMLKDLAFSGLIGPVEQCNDTSETFKQFGIKSSLVWLFLSGSLSRPSCLHCNRCPSNSQISTFRYIFTPGALGVQSFPIYWINQNFFQYEPNITRPTKYHF